MIELRRIVSILEETFHEFGPPTDHPARKAAVAAVVANPYAGRHELNILPMMEALPALGLDMSKRLIGILGGDAKSIQAYGKGAIVGTSGEIEHGALWHAPGGYAMREALGGAKAVVPSTKKVAGPGARLDVPLAHVDALYVRSHFAAMEVGVPGAPKADEIVFILAMATGGRIHARVGGLAHEAIKGEDGLR
jgi:hypothetical protein